MPAPNDLTPEDEALFAEHGVAPLGQGREPVDDGQQPQQVDDQQVDNQQQQQVQHGDRHPSQQQDDGAVEEVSNRRADGTFKSKEEMDTERAALAQQEPKMVPLAALHQERQRIAEISRRAQLAETRMNAMIANGFGQQRQGQQAQPQKPDLVESPAEYILNIERRLEEFEQSRQQDQETRQLDSALTNDEDLYKMSVPDYDQASHYFVQSRARELLQFYPPDEAQRMMTEEARNIAKQAWARGQSAGEVIYNLAQARGYVRGQAQPQGQQPQGQQQNGPSATDTVRSIRQGQAASRSLSGGRGGGAQALNAQALLEMNDDEFEAYLGIGKKGANERFSAIG